MRPRTVVSLEQALSLPSATLRFAQMGWRVIKIEAAPTGKGLPGDPNRYVGRADFEDDLSTYFVAPNVGKESVVLDLKSQEGRDLLHRIIRELDADVFCCNTLPGRYESFGIDYATLKAIKPNIIWAAISALGPDHPNSPGYDPMVQAMVGYMEVTGQIGGPPTLSGIPLVDLKAGDEVYAGVCLALAEQAESGEGKQFHVSMLQAAASWLVTLIPLLDLDDAGDAVTRAGNQHRKFIPVNAYPTSDGFIYLAIGNDAQWRRLIGLEKFAGLANEARETNEGRAADREAVFREIGEITARYPGDELAAEFADAIIPNAPINDIEQVRAIPTLQKVLTRTTAPDGTVIRMQPPAVDIPGFDGDMAFAPKYGEHTRSVLSEAGVSDGEISKLEADGIVAAWHEQE